MGPLTVTGLFTLLLVLHVVGAIVFAIAVSELHRWREWHHVYLGLATGAIGWLLAAAAPPVWLAYAGLALLLFGAWIVWDDALSHARQARDPDFPRRGSRGHLDYATSWWHRQAHRVGLI